MTYQRVPLVEKELLNLPEHLSSPPVFCGVRVTRPLVMCMFGRSLLVILAIVLSVFLSYTYSDYPFGIFKLFLHCVKLLILFILFYA